MVLFHRVFHSVYGHAKHDANYGHTEIAGKQILCKGLSPLITGHRGSRLLTQPG